MLGDMGYVTNEQLAPIREEANNTGEGVVDMLISRRILKPEYVAQAKAAHFSVEFVNLSELRIEDDVISAIPRHIAKRYRAVPVSKYGSSVRIAVADPSDLDTL